MKSLKTKWLHICNKIILATLVLLGFYGCGGDDDVINPNEGGGDDPGEITLEYGMPQVVYKLKGKVVNSRKTPVKDIQMIVKPNKQSYLPPDTLYTNEEGIFSYQSREWVASEIKVIYQDFREQDIVYQTDSIVVAMGEPSGGDGKWNHGVSSKEVTIELTEKKKDGK